MKLVDLALYTPRPLTDEGLELENKSRAIFTAIAKRLKRDVETEDFRKINVMINSVSPNKFTVGLSTLGYHIEKFDIASFLNKSVSQQKDMLLTLGIEVLSDVFSEFDLKGPSLTAIKRGIVHNGFRNTYFGPVSEGFACRARIKIVQGFDCSEIFLEVKKKRTLQVERKLWEIESTSPFIFQAYLKKLDWISSKKLNLNIMNKGDHLIEF